MKQIRFFAIEDDLLLVLREVELALPLQFVRTTSSPSPALDRFDASSEIPRIGTATGDSAISGDAYLVAEKSAEIRARRIDLDNGGRMFSIDQLENDESVVLTPGGKWSGEIVLNGVVSTATVSAASARIMKAFDRAIRKHFTKKKAYWVGPKALDMLRSGKRLTISAHSPRDFDLAPD